jgi:hypothetical protein
MKLTHQVDIKLASGPTATHTSELLDIRHEGDGSSTAIAACCGKVGDIHACPMCNGAGCPACGGKGHIKDEHTRSSHNFYDIAGMTDDDLTTVLQGHVERVANHHAGAHRAKDFMAAFTAAAQPPTDAVVGTPGKVG